MIEGEVWKVKWIDLTVSNVAKCDKHVRLPLVCRSDVIRLAS